MELGSTTKIPVKRQQNAPPKNNAENTFLPYGQNS